MMMIGVQLSYYTRRTTVHKIMYSHTPMHKIIHVHTTMPKIMHTRMPNR